MKLKKTCSLIIALALLCSSASALIGCGEISAGGRKDPPSWTGASSESTESSEGESSKYSEESEREEGAVGSTGSSSKEWENESGSGEVGGEIPTERTKLNVFHYKAGYGSQWIENLARRFEDKMENVSFGDGKRGVEITIVGEMRDFTSPQLLSSPHDVFFLEGSKNLLALMANGMLEPLDSVATEKTWANGFRSVSEKMTTEQRAAYALDGTYYALPHYVGGYGIIYNREMFEEQGFFLAAEPQRNSVLISESNPTKSVGLDGVADTYDDGLPTTYDEFFALCAEINGRGIDPVGITGEYIEHHVTQLFDSLIANNLGAEQAKLNYTFDGTAKELVVFDSQGNMRLDSNGEPLTESLAITADNAWNLSRQKGKYDALTFIERLLDNPDYYDEVSADISYLSNLEMQRLFLQNGMLGETEKAMIVDGAWWQTEASGYFEEMASIDEKWSKENRRFGWMPLPQPTKDDAQAIANGSKKSTYIDYLNAVACVKAYLDEDVKRAAFEFLRFAYSDEELVEFTYTTGTPIGLDYWDKIDYSELTYYEYTLIEHMKNAEMVYPVSGNGAYLGHMAVFNTAYKYGSVYGGVNYINPVRGIWWRGLSAKDYFAGHQPWYKNLIW